MRGIEREGTAASLYEIPRLVQAALIPAALFRDREPARLPTPPSHKRLPARASRPPPPRIIRATYNPHCFDLPVNSLYPATHTHRGIEPRAYRQRRMKVNLEALFDIVSVSCSRHSARRDFLNNRVTPSSCSSPEVARGGVLARRARAPTALHSTFYGIAEKVTDLWAPKRNVPRSLM